MLLTPFDVRVGITGQWQRHFNKSFLGVPSLSVIHVSSDQIEYLLPLHIEILKNDPKTEVKASKMEGQYLVSLSPASFSWADNPERWTLKVLNPYVIQRSKTRLRSHSFYYAALLHEKVIRWLEEWIIERIRNPKNIGFYDNVNRNQKSWSAKISVKHLQIRFKSEARELEVHFTFNSVADRQEQTRDGTYSDKSITHRPHSLHTLVFCRRLCSLESQALLSFSTNLSSWIRCNAYRRKLRCRRCVTSSSTKKNWSNITIHIRQWWFFMATCRSTCIQVMSDFSLHFESGGYSYDVLPTLHPHCENLMAST